MTQSAAKKVWKVIEDDIVVKRSLEKGIASLKNLAVYLIKRYDIDATSDAVISAIRRYKEEQPLEKKYKHAKNVIKQSKGISITSNIVNISLEKNKQTQELLQKAFSLVNYEKGEILLIIQGEQSIKLIINDKNKDNIIKFFPKKSIIDINKNLAELKINLTDHAKDTPGIMSIFSTELMLHEINVEETMSCLPEMMFFVKQKDVVRSYEILFNLCNQE